MVLDLYDMMLGAGVVFVIYATIKYSMKSNRFKHCETTEGECTEVRSTRYNFVACTTRYFYTYMVDGVCYTGEDPEGSWFRYKHKDLTNPVTVEYLKDNPEVSRLAVVNHKNLKTAVLSTLIATAAYAYLILHKNGML